MLDPIAIFSSMSLNDGEAEYLKMQSKRLVYLGELVQKYCNKIAGQANILDIGPHFLTRYILETVNPRPQMSTIGFAFPKLVPLEMIKEHVTLDLNDCETAPKIFSSRLFDIITICEVVEHLHVPPDVILQFLKQFLNSKRGVIIVGTPNAVCLANRIRMMMGENPFHLLHPDKKSRYARHIREYTMQELRTYGKAAKLGVDFEEYCDYWGQGIFIKNISELERDVPSYRTGLTIVYRPEE